MFGCLIVAGVLCLEYVPSAKVGFLSLGCVLSAPGETESQGQCQPQTTAWTCQSLPPAPVTFSHTYLPSLHMNVYHPSLLFHQDKIILECRKKYFLLSKHTKFRHFVLFMVNFYPCYYWCRIYRKVCKCIWCIFYLFHYSPVVFEALYILIHSLFLCWAQVYIPAFQSQMIHTAKKTNSAGALN